MNGIVLVLLLIILFVIAIVDRKKPKSEIESEIADAKRSVFLRRIK